MNFIGDTPNGGLTSDPPGGNLGETEGTNIVGDTPAGGLSGETPGGN